MAGSYAGKSTGEGVAMEGVEFEGAQGGDAGVGDAPRGPRMGGR